MGFLFWAIVVVLGLAAVNRVACWFGLDVAGAEGSGQELAIEAHGTGRIDSDGG